MSDFQGHLTTGVITSSVVTCAYGIANSGLFFHSRITPIEIGIVFFAVVFGSLAPDLDTHSIPSRAFSFLLFIFLAWSIYRQDPYPGIQIAMIYAFIKSFTHRSITHTYTISLVIIGIGFGLGRVDIICFGVGTITHLCTDKIYPNQKSSWIKKLKL